MSNDFKFALNSVNLEKVEYMYGESLILESPFKNIGLLIIE